MNCPVSISLFGNRFSKNVFWVSLSSPIRFWPARAWIVYTFSLMSNCKQFWFWYRNIAELSSPSWRSFRGRAGDIKLVSRYLHALCTKSTSSSCFILAWEIVDKYPSKRGSNMGIALTMNLIWALPPLSLDWPLYTRSTRSESAPAIYLLWIDFELLKLWKLKIMLNAGTESRTDPDELDPFSWVK